MNSVSYISGIYRLVLYIDSSYNGYCMHGIPHPRKGEKERKEAKGITLKSKEWVGELNKRNGYSWTPMMILIKIHKGDS